MGNLEIRPCEPSDQAEIIQLWLDCDLVVPWNDPVKDIAAKSLVQPELFLVGLLSGKIVASAMAGYDGHRGSVFYLAVSPEHRRKGYGGLLMGRVESGLRNLGCQKINIQIRGTNLDVIEFYRSLGYKDEDVISLGKRLDD
jgi:ribosomal protein S18 acetylase RimI-like enzyme